MNSSKIVVINGSVRKNNLTGQALQIVIKELNYFDNVAVDYIDPKDFSLSFPGLRSEIDDSSRLKEIIKSADGVIIGTPEYNGTFTSVLKLIIENLGYPSVLKNKPVALIGVASGRIGAVKALEHLRTVCSHEGALVLPWEISIAHINKYFDFEGNCLDEDVESQIRSVAQNLLKFLFANNSELINI